MLKKSDGFIMIEFLTYFFIFSLIILLTFNLVIYFLTNIAFFVENPPLKHPVLEGFDKYLRFTDNAYISSNRLYFSYKEENYYIANENENLVLYRNGIKNFESVKYKILNYNVDTEKIEIVFKDKTNNVEINYSVTNIN